ncbi:MAG: tRNA threonylcarbamoyladenosine biosynthesis protein RimN [Gammaproteobacteria bacterium]|nr:tRNA threonylcarbamoyladenosine biosynthesis protein RimN [Gammaproteobacteria bacterium]
MSSFHIKLARRFLWGGGVIAYPTEAVYGLGCDPFNREAISRLLDLKRRDMAKGLILIASDIRQVADLVRIPSGSARERIVSSWPGFTTWVLPVRADIPYWLTGEHGTLAVRVTAHRTAAALCREFGGPLVSTSANPSRLPPAGNRTTLRRYFGPALDYIVPGSLGGETRPSEIRDAASGERLRL